MKDIKLRLTVMNFLQFAVWGAYLTSMGRYLGSPLELGGAGLGGDYIGSFYAMQGIVSLFMPALMGIVADRWIRAERLLGLCHFIAATAMITAWMYANQSGFNPGKLYIIYSLSVAFYMPTLALSNSVAYTSLEQNKEDLVKSFPPIRVFGTIGFICMMLLVSLLGFESKSEQFLVSGLIGFILAGYTLSLPQCPIATKKESKGIVEALGLKAFALFRQPKMALFFIFSMLLGVSLQITNGFANPFLGDFGSLAEYADSFGVRYSNILIALSQVSETLCILLIPFALKRFGIKNVMLIAMLAWALRFLFLGLGNPGEGIWYFILSMLVYGVAFDFFNVSGSLFVDNETDVSIRSSAQGLFMIMTNGIGATLGSFAAGSITQHYVYSQTDISAKIAGWQYSWYIFASYALVVTILFALLFRYRHQHNTSTLAH